MTRYLAAAAALALLLLPVSTLRAQESDDEWLSNCREGWGDWGSRARHCEIRETGMKATGRPLTIDPGHRLAGCPCGACAAPSVVLICRTPQGACRGAIFV